MRQNSIIIINKFQDEIEFVLKFRTNSWVAIGWKSKNSNHTCSLNSFFKQDLSTAKDITTYMSTVPHRSIVESTEIIPSVPIIAKNISFESLILSTFKNNHFFNNFRPQNYKNN